MDSDPYLQAYLRRNDVLGSNDACCVTAGSQIRCMPRFGFQALPAELPQQVSEIQCTEMNAAGHADRPQGRAEPRRGPRWAADKIRNSPRFCTGKQICKGPRVDQNSSMRTQSRTEALKIPPFICEIRF